MGNRQSCCVNNRRFRNHSNTGKTNSSCVNDTLASGDSNMGRTSSSMSKYKVETGTTITSSVGTVQTSVDTSQHRLSKNVSSMSASGAGSRGSGIVRDHKVGTSSGGTFQIPPDLSTRKSREMPDTRVVAFFERYRDSDDASDAILVSGVETLCSDLSLSPDEFRVLLLAWSAGADRMCRFTRDEFYAACRTLHADTPATMSAALNELAVDISSNRTRFRDLYRWSYQFALDKEISQRSLPLDMAIALWRLLFSSHTFEGSSDGKKDKQKEHHRVERRSSKRKESSSQDNSVICLLNIVERWIEFLTLHATVSVIPRDTWDMFLHFVLTVGDDLAMYSDEEAWPSLLDDFVEYETDRRNQNLVEDLIGGKND